MMPPALAYQDGPWDGPRVTLVNPTRARPVQDSTVFSNPRPAWANEALQKLGALMDLRSGWDGHVGKPISSVALSYTFNILGHIMQPGVPLPSITPLSYGGVQLEWHRKGWDLEIEIVGAGKIQVFARDIQSGEESELELGADLSALSGHIDKVKD